MSIRSLNNVNNTTLEEWNIRKDKAFLLETISWPLLLFPLVFVFSVET